MSVSQLKSVLVNAVFSPVLSGCAALMIALLFLICPGSFSAFAEESLEDADVESVSGDVTESGEWNDRYAVAIYGIQHDTWDDGASSGIAGLSFGPATGGDFHNQYRAHVTEEEYLSDPERNICLHWMTWEEIADRSQADPTVFHDCLVYGCTHAIDLNLNDQLLGKDYSASISGDGVTGLNEGLSLPYLTYNTGTSCPGGWPACRVRATLNGADDLTNPAVAGENLLSEDNCLFSCFPAVLRERIVPREVISDLLNGRNGTDCVVTYDRLWLFSPVEFYGGQMISEGLPYERNELIRNGESAVKTYLMYTEKGNESQAWFRSISGLDEVYFYHIYGGGHSTPSGYYNYYSLAPGFCLP